ncbi:uncharacterized protein LOC124722600 [Schistocerca piceifrons]|uniref:uncharacterized protein LOC124722600 n=1 Tax=Schistocerca piceifrons TaxID=274613 RepID=UPI001F5F44CD|nr:uncharacterized protein LOC124722600 [Schistocerca piceifrons]
MLHKLGQVAARSGSLRSGVSRAYHPPADFKPQSMDDLPVPQGSWQANYEEKQRRYNTHLFGGIAFAAFSLLVAKNSGLFYMNWAPPELKKE